MNPLSGIKELELHHPYVSYDPQLVLGDSEYKGKVVFYEELKAATFHELFHTIGYLHGPSIEYPYACEECCFPMYPDVKELACRLCSEDYSSVSDQRYIKDLKAYAAASDTWLWISASATLCS